jgi:uncharacterized integral membrane protein
MNESAKQPPQLMKKIKIAALGFIAIAALIVFFQNTETVTTRFLFATVAMPRALLLILTFAAGVAVGLIVATYMRVKKKSK